MSESLAGRFFLHRCSHWPYAECRDAFGWSLPRWLYFGGYPGAAAFIDNETDWKSYITDSLIETVLARDVLHMHKVTKPVLLRHLFALAATLPAQCVSYTKMLGQLHDAGNTTTLAQYLKLLESAFLASGLELFPLGVRRKRGSSPKLLLWNNGLISALSTRQLPGEGPRRHHLVGAAGGERGGRAPLQHAFTGDAHRHLLARRPRRGRFCRRQRYEGVGHRGGGRSGKASGLERFRAKYPAAERCWSARRVSRWRSFSTPIEAWLR